MPDFFVGDASQQVGMPALWDGNIWVGHSPVIGGFRVEDFFDSPVDAAGDALDVCGGGGADAAADIGKRKLADFFNTHRRQYVGGVCDGGERDHLIVEH